MLKSFLISIFILGAIIVCTFLNVYWLIAWLGLWFAFRLTSIKLTISDALRLWGIVIFIVAAMLGGGTILARLFGEWAGGIWICVCIVFLMILRKKLIRLIPMLHLAQTFEDIVKGKIKK